MIPNLQPYPKYKDSGVEWLGKVPEEWEVLPNRTLFQEIKDSNHPEEPLISVTISKGIIKQSDLIDNTSKKDSSNEDKTKYKLVKPGDIAYNKMRAWQGAIGISDLRGIVSPAYIIQRPRRKLQNGYFHYLLRTPLFAKEAERWSYGITSDQWSLRSEHFKMIYCSLPPIEEQSDIVRYLNYTNNRIQQYITSKHKLVKLLEEQKQAIIHQAVTGAIDVTTGKPYPKYKDSGVKWFGKVPEAWEMRRLRTLATMIVSNVDKHTIDGESSVRLCNYVDVYKNERITNEVKFMKASVNSDELTNYKIKIGDVILTKDSETWTDIGVPSLVEYEADDLICGYHLAMVRPFKGTILGEFILRLLQNSSIATQLHVSANGVTRYGLSHGDIKDVLFPIPTINEQQNIINYLNINLSLIDKAINRARKEIVLLQEYRIRLTADVVTGKIDVREVAKNMPPEVTGSIVYDPNNDDAEDNEMLDGVIEE